MPSAALHRIGANLSWLVGERILRMLVGLFVIGYVARYLGKTNFGLLNYAISMTAIFSAVANMGVDGIVIRELIKLPGSRNQILGTAWLLKICGAIGAISLMGLFAFFTNHERGATPLMLLVSCSFLPQSFEVIDLWFQKDIRSKYTVIAKLIATTMSAAVKFSFVWFKGPLILFCLTQVLDAAFFATGLILVFRTQGGSIFDWSPSKQMARSLLRDAYPLIISGILVAIYGRVEQILVMDWLGAETAGTYYASVRITDIWNMIPALLLPTLYPLLVAKRGSAPKEYRQGLQKVFDVLTVCGLLIALGGTFLAPFIIRTIYGSRFADAAAVLTIQAWTAPFTFTGAVRCQYFVIERLTPYHTLCACIGLALNVALATWLLPFVGARGAALSSLAGYAVSAYATSLLFRDLHDCARIQTKAFFFLFRVPNLIWNLRYK